MFSHKQYILFDLDGTLTDPKIGITKSVQYALASFGINANTDDLHCFIGPPLKNAFMDFYSFTEDDAELAVKKYREYFTEHGLFENSLYPGIPKLLERLYINYNLVVATSKPIVFARQILKHFNIDKYFTFIAGAELDGTRSDKAQVIEYAMEGCGATNSDQCVMIGDRSYDIIGAKKHSMDSIGVLYGYGSREELENSGCSNIAETVYSIGKYFAG